MIYQGKARAPVREAVIHCAAIKTGQFKGQRPFQVFSTINRWHHERGFTNGFGYHGLVMPDGSFYSGRPYSMIGAHVQGHNTGTLGFLLIESREITRIGEFEDWFTPVQRQTLRRELGYVSGLERVTGHNDHANRLCPGFKVKTSDWL
ncbi:N-acetylmuramoyl-L-alanine amidase [Pseudogemmobacter humi]|uniref:N-acetylmuramoyl-L-alanine amidase n=1 Tax=Pseudogemmobacter humi TaxID=2483812 RepID=A0A3P5XB19_9RHOB|nr:N-acetylmuramoyl-L-alanine amidase [Pseudogemmobacter humi]VDC31846.1 N-acetylmuramoyl-L-alanine amidase [Pseudogemmobacter humi]